MRYCLKSKQTEQGTVTKHKTSGRRTGGVGVKPRGRLVSMYRALGSTPRQCQRGERTVIHMRHRHMKLLETNGAVPVESSL